jgi:hypothetical protein
VPRLIFTSLALLVVASAPAVAQKKSLPAVEPARVSAKSAPLTKQECERFALAFEEAVRTKDWRSAEKEIDWTTLYTRATNGIPAPDKTRASFRETADTYFRGDNGCIAGLVHTVSNGGSFRFLRAIDTGAETRVLFRLTRQSGDVPDYVTLVLAAERDGSAVATDIENASEGDRASVRLRRYFIGLSASATRGLADKLQGVDKARVRWQKELETAQELFREGQNKKALETLEALPEDIKNDHSVVLQRLNAARALSPEAFLAVLEGVRANAKNDIAVELIALDRFMGTKSFAAARQAVVALSESVGGDGYLDWLLAQIEDEAGENGAAIAACKRAIAHDESLLEPWWTMLSIFNRQGRYSDVLSTMEAMHARFEIDWRSTERAPEFVAFLGTEYGKSWKTRRTTPR